MSRKLLLADDSITIQRVVELTFAGEDVEVLTVGDGEQAIARVQSDKPDIVLADIGMPKRSGYDVSTFIKKDPALSHIPVLLLTGAFEPVDEDRVREAGCDGVLIKPFEPQHVIARVRELLGGAIGSPMKATSDVPRPVERLSASRAVPPPAPSSSEGPGSQPSTPSLRLVATPPKAAASPVSPASAQQAAQSKVLEDYFDQLDAAFAARAAGLDVPPLTPAPEPEEAPPSPAPAPAAAAPAHQPAPPAPVEARAPGPVEPTPAAPAAHVALPSPVAPVTTVEPLRWPEPEELPVEPAKVPRPAEASERGPIADAFSALLAVEQGEPGARPVRLTVTHSEPIDDELIEKIVRRVVERLAPDAVKDVVTDVVSDVTERLVRDEIDRIRKRTT